MTVRVVRGAAWVEPGETLFVHTDEDHIWVRLTPNGLIKAPGPYRKEYVDELIEVLQTVKEEVDG